MKRNQWRSYSAEMIAGGSHAPGCEEVAECVEFVASPFAGGVQIGLHGGEIGESL